MTSVFTAGLTYLVKSKALKIKLNNPLQSILIISGS